jgi:hypothetical protein
MGKKKKKPTTSMVAKIDGITDPEAAQKIQADIAKKKYPKKLK